MADNKGFTLIEIIAVLVIVAILAVFAVSRFAVSIEQTKAQAAKNNLLAVSAAQSKFYEDYGSYCIATGTNPTGNTTHCGDSYADLNVNLSLNIPANDPFTYSCSGAYTCTASDGTVTLTTTGSGVSCSVGGNDCPY